MPPTPQQDTAAAPAAIASENSTSQEVIAKLRAQLVAADAARAAVAATRSKGPVVSVLIMATTAGALTAAQRLVSNELYSGRRTRRS